jgi:hypothetical protein
MKEVKVVCVKYDNDMGKVNELLNSGWDLHATHTDITPASSNIWVTFILIKESE